MKVLTERSLKCFGFSLMRGRNSFFEIFPGSRALLFQSTTDLFTPNGSSPKRALARLLREHVFPLLFASYVPGSLSVAESCRIVRK